MAKIISCEEFGFGPTYDLEVEHCEHQYFLSNGVLTSNSHALSYSIVSFQCAYLATYYPNEWMVAFLEKEPEEKKARAIGVARTHGFDIRTVDINKSPAYEWETTDGEENRTLFQPLVSIKGLGKAAIQQIIDNRPFDSIEQFLFSKTVSYSKLNKKAIDILVRCGALNSLMDSRFSGMKHFWSCVAVDRPKTEKVFHDNIELYKKEGDFTRDEKINFVFDLTGYYPVDQILTDKEYDKLEKLCIPPISQWDSATKMAWFIPRSVLIKKTATKKEYFIVTVVDNHGGMETIKMWGVDSRKDIIPINRLCIANLDYDDAWGFSIRNVRKNFRAC